MIGGTFPRLCFWEVRHPNAVTPCHATALGLSPRIYKRGHLSNDQHIARQQWCQT